MSSSVPDVVILFPKPYFNDQKLKKKAFHSSFFSPARLTLSSADTWISGFGSVDPFLRVSTKGQVKSSFILILFGISLCFFSVSSQFGGFTVTTTDYRVNCDRSRVGLQLIVSADSYSILQCFVFLPPTTEKDLCQIQKY